MTNAQNIYKIQNYICTMTPPMKGETGYRETTLQATTSNELADLRGSCYELPLCVTQSLYRPRSLDLQAAY